MNFKQIEHGIFQIKKNGQVIYKKEFCKSKKEHNTSYQNKQIELLLNKMIINK